MQRHFRRRGPLLFFCAGCPMAPACAYDELPRKLEVLTKARAYCERSKKRAVGRLVYVNGKLEEAGLEPLANLNALRKQFSILDDQKNIVRAKSRNKKLQAHDALEAGWQCKDEEEWSNLYCNYVVARRVVESCSSDDLSSVEIQEKRRQQSLEEKLG